MTKLPRHRWCSRCTLYTNLCQLWVKVIMNHELFFASLFEHYVSATVFLIFHAIERRKVYRRAHSFFLLHIKHFRFTFSFLFGIERVYWTRYQWICIVFVSLLLFLLNSAAAFLGLSHCLNNMLAAAPCILFMC